MTPSITKLRFLPSAAFTSSDPPSLFSLLQSFPDHYHCSGSQLGHPSLCVMCWILAPLRHSYKLPFILLRQESAFFILLSPTMQIEDCLCTIFFTAGLPSSLFAFSCLPGLASHSQPVFSSFISFYVSLLIVTTAIVCVSLVTMPSFLVFGFPLAASRHSSHKNIMIFLWLYILAEAFSPTLAVRNHSLHSSHSMPLYLFVTLSPCTHCNHLQPSWFLLVFVNLGSNLGNAGLESLTFSLDLSSVQLQLSL